MKSKILIIGMIFSLASCNKKAEDTQVVTEKEMEQPEISVSEKQCYLWTKGKDSISMSLVTANGNNVTGELKYNFFEKDDSSGTVSGMYKGDTLYVDYNFEAEGTKSFREAVFIKKGTTLVQGFGDVEQKDNKEVFKDKKTLKFDESVVLNEVDCK